MSGHAARLPFGLRLTVTFLRVFAFVCLLWLMLAGVALAVLCLHGATVAGSVSLGLRSWGVSLGALACVAFLFALVRGPTLLAGSMRDVHRGSAMGERNWGRDLLWDVVAFAVTVAASFFTIQFLFALAISIFSGVDPARSVVLGLDLLCCVAGWIFLPGIAKRQEG